MEWLKRVADRWWTFAGIGALDGATGMVVQVGTDVLVWQSNIGGHGNGEVRGNGHETVAEATNCAYGTVASIEGDRHWRRTDSWQDARIREATA